MSEQITDERIDLDGMLPHPRNYNEHPEAQIAELAESLRVFGQPRSIVVWHNYVIAGHGVVAGARRLGWKALDARRLPDDWPEHKALAYLAADNELARGGAPNMLALAKLAEEVRREDETLGRLAAGGPEALAELADLEGKVTTNGETSSRRNLGTPARQIKPVLYVEQVADFERALRATGNINRGEAIITVCRFYLEHHAEGQLNTNAESSLAALAALTG